MSAARRETGIGVRSESVVEDIIGGREVQTVRGTLEVRGKDDAAN